MKRTKIKKQSPRTAQVLKIWKLQLISAKIGVPVVSLIAIYSNDQSSNPAKVYRKLQTGAKRALIINKYLKPMSQQILQLVDYTQLQGHAVPTTLTIQSKLDRCRWQSTERLPSYRTVPNDSKLQATRTVSNFFYIER